MCSSKPKAPKAPVYNPAPVAPTVVAPIEADTSSQSAGDEERRRRKAASGRSDTILTSGAGVSGQASTGGKKLLGE
ncbi:hypothetical protein C4J81_17175 [Deltaproteobacteria bacterium Smac51]|nr:hypothetical protein C4J81_17175 [Deltaproteobacteria bacterium Smac51]